jgi:hypothetical protein
MAGGKPASWRRNGRGHGEKVIRKVMLLKHAFFAYSYNDEPWRMKDIASCRVPH